MTNEVIILIPEVLSKDGTSFILRRYIKGLFSLILLFYRCQAALAFGNMLPDFV